MQIFILKFMPSSKVKQLETLLRYSGRLLVGCLAWFLLSPHQVFVRRSQSTQEQQLEMPRLLQLLYYYSQKMALPSKVSGMAFVAVLLKLLESDSNLS